VCSSLCVLSSPVCVRVTGLLKDGASPFAAAVARLMKGSVDVLSEAVPQLPPLLGYPLSETAATEEFKAVSVEGGVLCLRGGEGGGVWGGALGWQWVGTGLVGGGG
jgi:hypothetical protein